MYKEGEWCTSKYIHGLESKAQWTNYNINTSDTKLEEGEERLGLILELISIQV
jgi:hypothetical protein